MKRLPGPYLKSGEDLDQELPLDPQFLIQGSAEDEERHHHRDNEVIQSKCQCLHQSGFREHVSSYVGEHAGRLFHGGPVRQFRRIGERPVESVHVFAPVLKVVHVDVVFAHVVIVVDVRRMTPRVIANDLPTQQSLHVK